MDIFHANMATSVGEVAEEVCISLLGSEPSLSIIETALGQFAVGQFDVGTVRRGTVCRRDSSP